MSLDAAVKHSGMDISEVRVIHERPARIQELTQQPARFSSRSTDPVERAMTRGIHLDAQEAPQRQKEKDQDAQSELGKTRLVNKGNFRP